MAKHNPWGDAHGSAEANSVGSITSETSESNGEARDKIPLKLAPEFAKQEQAGTSPAPVSCFKIPEIAELSGIKDERETQRNLYILEGHKLVTPLPPGDLTSKNWQITITGLKTVQQLVQSRAAANA